MGQNTGNHGGHGGPKGGMPTGGKHGAGQVPGPQVQANLNNHSVQKNTDGGKPAAGGASPGGTGSTGKK